MVSDYQVQGQMSIFDFVKSDPKEWERFRDGFCKKQNGYMRFDNNGRKTSDKSFEVVKGCCFTNKWVNEMWDNWRPCDYESCQFIRGD